LKKLQENAHKYCIPIAKHTTQRTKAMDKEITMDTDLEEELTEEEREEELRNRELMIRESIAFMQTVTQVYGEAKGEEMWDTIVSTLDPSVKRQILMTMLKGNYATGIQLRGFYGQPKKVLAIKMVREVTGLGLKEAKDIVGQAYGFSGQRPMAWPAVTTGTPVNVPVNSRDRLEAIKKLESVGCFI